MFKLFLINSYGFAAWALWRRSVPGRTVPWTSKTIAEQGGACRAFACPLSHNRTWRKFRAFACCMRATGALSQVPADKIFDGFEPDEMPGCFQQAS
jgi:hypothetical protein